MPEAGQACCVEQTDRLARLRAVQRDEIGAGQRRVEIGDRIDTGRAHLVVGHVRVVGTHTHAEGPAQPSDA